MPVQKSVRSSLAGSRHASIPSRGGMPLQRGASKPRYATLYASVLPPGWDNMEALRQHCSKWGAVQRVSRWIENGTPCALIAFVDPTGADRACAALAERMPIFRVDQDADTIRSLINKYSRFNETRQRDHRIAFQQAQALAQQQQQQQQQNQQHEAELAWIAQAQLNNWYEPEHPYLENGSAPPPQQQQLQRLSTLDFSASPISSHPPAHPPPRPLSAARSASPPTGAAPTTDLSDELSDAMTLIASLRAELIAARADRAEAESRHRMDAEAVMQLRVKLGRAERTCRKSRETLEAFVAAAGSDANLRAGVEEVARGLLGEEEKLKVNTASASAAVNDSADRAPLPRLQVFQVEVEVARESSGSDVSSTATLSVGDPWP